MTQVD